MRNLQSKIQQAIKMKKLLYMVLSAGFVLASCTDLDEGIYDTLGMPVSQLSVPIEKNFVTKKAWLGTDKYGRDILSRLIIGVRVSLSVGLIAIIISITIGILLGAIAGYFRGWIDELIMWLINVIWSIPTLLLVFAITLVLGKGFWQVFIAVGLTMWVSVARIVRGHSAHHAGHCRVS